MSRSRADCAGPSTVFTAVVLVVIYIPLALVLLNSFNTDNTFGWPPPGLTLRWWTAGLAQPGCARRAPDQHQGGDAPRR